MKKSRLFIFLSISIISFILTLFLYRQDIEFLNAIDLKLKDIRFKMRGKIEPDENIVVVTIDQKSVNELGRWPWPRTLIAKLIENLADYGVKVTALDIVFSEKSDTLSDKKLAAAIEKTGNVILGYFFRDEPEEAFPISLRHLKRSKIKLTRFIGKKSKGVPVQGFPFVELNLPVLSEKAQDFGYFNIFPDRDGILRRYNLIGGFQDEIYPSLALTALRLYLDSEPIISIAPYGIDSIRIGNRKIPSEENGRIPINYYGKTGAFKTVPAVDVIKKRLPQNALRNGLVFVGATEIGIYDLRATPIDPVLPGVEVHGTIASNVLQNRFLLRDGRVIALEVLFMALFPFSLAFSLGLIRRTIPALIFFALFICVYATLNYSLFKECQLNMGIIYTPFSMAITYLSCEAYRNLVEEKKSRFLHKAFSSYISPELVSEIVKNPELLKLGGEKREITMLFSDIRGFTTVSEKVPPEAIVKILNGYLGPMTNIVLNHKGTLDKYMGDAIMAIYNAPLEIKNHPLLACKTAIDMMEALKNVNKGFKEVGFPEIDIGIGINTGEAIVGNMGTNVRFDYTAIGDVVNLSSRLEGLNKQYHTHIIVSESTKEKTDKNFRFRELDKIKVKGKEVPVAIYELDKALDNKLIDRFAEALAFYRSNNFTEALALFVTLEKEYNDKVSLVFSERCREFLKNPPSPDWDGVYVAKTK